MKKSKAQKKINLSISRVASLIIALTLFAVGLSVVGFGYFLFVRLPEADVVLKAEQEISDISVSFDAEKSARMFESNNQVPNITPPPYKTKNPFTPF